MHPVETEDPLHNPYRGWVFIGHAVPGEIGAGRSVPNVKSGSTGRLIRPIPPLIPSALRMINSANRIRHRPHGAGGLRVHEPGSR